MNRRKLDKTKSKNKARGVKAATTGGDQEILNHTWSVQELLFINFFFKRGEGNYIQKFLLFEGKDMNVLQQSFMVFELHFSLCQAVYYEGFKN